MFLSHSKFTKRDRVYLSSRPSAENRSFFVRGRLEPLACLVQWKLEYHPKEAGHEHLSDTEFPRDEGQGARALGPVVPVQVLAPRKYQRHFNNLVGTTSLVGQGNNHQQMCQKEKKDEGQQ